MYRGLNQNPERGQKENKDFKVVDVVVSFLKGLPKFSLSR